MHHGGDEESLAVLADFRNIIAGALLRQMLLYEISPKAVEVRLHGGNKFHVGWQLAIVFEGVDAVEIACDGINGSEVG